jgi:nucleotide-binding universal stress UspA family protein
MFTKIVVGYNGSSQSADALALGGFLAGSTRSSLLLGYVYHQEPRWYGQTREYLREQRDRSHRTLEPAMASLPEGVAADSAALGSSSPARGLHDLAAEERADLVVIGSTHHGPLGRVLIGGVGELLLAAAPFSVAVAPRGLQAKQHGPIAAVTAAFDGSPEAAVAVRAAASLVERLGARLRVVSVIEHSHGWHVSGPGDHGDHAHGDRARLEDDLGRAATEALGGFSAEHEIVEGKPVETLQEAAGSSDLLIVGSRGYGPMRHALLGSVSARLMRSAPSPVVLVPRGNVEEQERATPARPGAATRERA